MYEYFVDEHSARGYLLAAALLPTEQKTELRRLLNELRMPGQNRIHFVDERDSRRRLILTAITVMKPAITIVKSGTKNQKIARENCLRALMSHASRLGVIKVTFERDESVLQFDKRVLFRESQRLEPHRRVNYAHENPRSEPLLWIPDAVAWSFVKGGDWRRRISPLMENVIRIE